MVWGYGTGSFIVRRAMLGMWNVADIHKTMESQWGDFPQGSM